MLFKISTQKSAVPNFWDMGHGTWGMPAPAFAIGGPGGHVLVLSIPRPPAHAPRPTTGG